MSTITNFESYVNGYKVVSSDTTTVTLETGRTVDKSKCKFVSADIPGGATYYRYEEE